jgi:hypothetical protein
LLKGEGKGDRWNTIEENVELLRGLAGERGIPVITGAQANREGLKAGSGLDVSHMADSMGVLRTTDYLIALTQSAEERALGKLYQRVLLNRNEATGAIIECSVDYERCDLRNVFRTDSSDAAKKEVNGEENKRKETLAKARQISARTGIGVPPRKT